MMCCGGVAVFLLLFALRCIARCFESCELASLRACELLALVVATRACASERKRERNHPRPSTQTSDVGSKKKLFSVIGKLNRRILHFTIKLLMNEYFSSNFTMTR